jgi:integrase
VLLLFVRLYYGSFPSYFRAAFYNTKTDRMLSLRTYLRKNQANSLGECVIYFIVEDEWISSTVKVHPDYWDASNGIINKKHPKYYTINPTFQLYKSRAEQCISNYQISCSLFSRKFFEEFVFNGPDQTTNPSFLKIIDEYIKEIDLCLGRIKHYKTLRNDIECMVGNPKLNDINYSFALKLQKFLRNKEKAPNCLNTITSKIRQLKAVVHYAQKKGLIEKDPLAMLKLKETPGTKKYLTADELQILETLHKQKTLKGSEQQTLHYFLFSCYTGLRYSDLCALKFSNIIDSCVVATQEKTDKPVMVPLIPRAKDLLKLSNGHYCFKTFTNQATNRFLKLIMVAAGIDKKITYHCSRHTFGTLSIYWGIPDYVVAELMGIDFKTVKIYAKIVDQVKVREMEKWERKVEKTAG